MRNLKIGILGAGKLGTTLARIAEASGYSVLIANSHPVDELKWIIDVLAPKATVVTADDLIKQSDIIILAIPMSKANQLEPELFANKIIFDATNYWLESDGPTSIASNHEATSEVLQNHFKSSKLVKVFNHMGYHDLEVEIDRHPNPKRVMAFATNHQELKPMVETIISSFGLEPYDLGDLHQSIVLEPGSPLFGAALPLNKFKDTLKNLK